MAEEEGRERRACEKAWLEECERRERAWEAEHAEEAENAKEK